MVMQSYTVDRSNEYDAIGMSFRPLPFFKTSIMSWLRFGIHWAANGWELVVCVCACVSNGLHGTCFLVSYHSIWVGLKTIDPPIMTGRNQEFVWYASWVFVKPQ